MTKGGVDGKKLFPLVAVAGTKEIKTKIRATLYSHDV